MQLSSLLVLALTCMVLVIVSVGGWRSWVGQLNTSKVRVGNITSVNPITWIRPFPLRRPMFLGSAV